MSNDKVNIIDLSIKMAERDMRILDDIEQRLNAAEMAERRKDDLIILGKGAPALFGLALRNAAEAYRWRTFWL